jgi:hypothetical protein
LIIKIFLPTQFDPLCVNALQIQDGGQGLGDSAATERNLAQKYGLPIVVNAENALRAADIQQIYRLLLEFRIIILKTIAQGE